MASITVYPDADPESTSTDGWGRSVTAGDTWANVRNTAGVHPDPNSTSLYTGFQDKSDGTTWIQIYRSITLFDTSAIGDTDTIDSATYSLYGIAKVSNAGTNLNYNVYATTPASNTTLADTDFDIGDFGSTTFATAINHTSMVTSAYNDFTLNASGLAAISKTGITKFACLLENDVANSAPTHDGDGTTDFDRMEFASADTAGTTTDPKLVVNYTPPAVTFRPHVIIT